MRRSLRPGVVAAADGRPASAAVDSRAGRRLIAPLLIAAAVLDLTRCSLVLVTFRHPAPAAGVVAAGIGAAGLSLTAARGCRAGHRWAAWTALLIGIASAPQASASGFRTPFMFPDVATAVLGVLLAVAILATVRSPAPRAGQPQRGSIQWQRRGICFTATSTTSFPSETPNAVGRPSGEPIPKT